MLPSPSGPAIPPTLHRGQSHQRRRPSLPVTFYAYPPGNHLAPPLETQPERLNHSNEGTLTSTSTQTVANTQQQEPAGWETVWSPLGIQNYYYHSTYRVVLDTYPDEWLCSTIDAAMKGQDLPPKCEWYYRKDGRLLYVNHEAETGIIIEDGKTPQEDSYQKSTPDANKSKYWEFVRKHPFHLKRFQYTVSASARTQALNVLTLLLGMHALSTKPPIAPFSKAQCIEMREILAVGTQEQEFCEFEYRTYMIAAILEKIYAQRCWRKGQAEDSEKPMKPNYLSVLITYIFNTVLLGLPMHYQSQIEKIKRVRIEKEEIPHHCRKEIIEKTKGEHHIALVAASLLLAASLTTMAIPGIDSRSTLLAGVAAQCAFSSVLINIVALWQYASTLDDDVISGRQYFRRDTALIARLQSLPLATLYWGLMFFGVAGCNFPFRAARRGELQRGEVEHLLTPHQKTFATVTMGLLALAMIVAIGDAFCTKFLALTSEKTSGNGVHTSRPQGGRP